MEELCYANIYIYIVVVGGKNYVSTFVILHLEGRLKLRKRKESGQSSRRGPEDEATFVACCT